MKTFRTTFTVVAFALATGAGLAFTPSANTTDTILVQGLDSHCPLGEVSDLCSTNNWGAACTFTIIFRTYEAVEYNEPICQESLVLRYPNF